MEDGNTLEVRNLTVQFAIDGGTVHAVNGIDFDVRRGETVCIVGESGAGKSVTGYSVMQLLNGGKPSERIRQSGSIKLRITDGSVCSILDLSDRRLRSIRGREMSMIYQEPMTTLNPVLSCGEQIREVIATHTQTSRDKADEQALELLRHVGIPDPQRAFRSFPHEMSGGMQQRIVIAMAVALHPALLIADEPTTALDVTIQAQILNLLLRIQKSSGTSILFVTHDIGVVAQLADRVIVMYAGHVVEVGDVDSLFSDPLHPYTKGLLASVPGHHGDEDVGPLPSIVGTMPDPTSLPSGCPFHPRCPWRVRECEAELPPDSVVSADRRVRCIRYTELRGVLHE